MALNVDKEVACPILREREFQKVAERTTKVFWNDADLWWCRGQRVEI